MVRRIGFERKGMRVKASIRAKFSGPVNGAGAFARLPSCGPHGTTQGRS